MTFLRAPVAALVLAAAAMLAALLAVDIRSWRRTRDLRKGVAGPGIALPARLPSSGATHLASCSGASLFAGGVISLFSGVGEGILLLLAGGFIWLTGFWARVASIEADPAGLTIRYRRRKPFTLSWRDCRSVRPPRSPTGGWRLQGTAGRRTLMGSDLRGHENVLDAVVRNAGLRFAGRQWRAPERSLDGKKAAST